MLQNGLARLRNAPLVLGTMLALGLSFSGTARAADPPAPVPCTGGAVKQQDILLPQPSIQPDLEVSGECTVGPGQYYFAAVNILKGGKLIFMEDARPSAPINFWTTGIIVENGGVMSAGAAPDMPYGTNQGTLNIVLYGKDESNGKQGQGIVCKTKVNAANGPCGVPPKTWNANGAVAKMPGGAADDNFYQYGPLRGDKAAGPKGVGYFGYKVIGLSFGGTLQLRGLKGTSGAAAADAAVPPGQGSGTGWLRLADNTMLKVNDPSLRLEKSVGEDWRNGNETDPVEIVVTTTDYIPGHSELLKVDSVAGATINLKDKIQYPHNGTRYPLKTRLSAAIGRLGIDPLLTDAGVETRAAVALMTRSIRIVSGGDVAGETFDAATARTAKGSYYFGGHTVFRQGFAALQIQGVEFKQLGQGGRQGHYPVHFHMVRNPPPNTYVKDSSINESMTHWIGLHSTNSVTFARNVGFKSIGHGFFMEAGTETDNKFYSNLGINARAAVYSDLENPRRVPGIFAANDRQGDAFPHISDVNHPSVFWITNAWNDFVGNVAAGAGTCGSCYWFVPQMNSDMDDITMKPMAWKGYSAIQARINGGSPVKNFYKNSCSSAMNSLITVGNTAACNGVIAPPPVGADPPANLISAIRSIAPNPGSGMDADMYYPRIGGDTRLPTVCDPAKPDSDENSCARVPPCSFGDPKTCATSVIDHYTTSFNWADFNFSAMWLRNGWYLLDNSVITDPQLAGLTMVSGGDYTRASVPEGYWALASHNIFIGQTQPNNSFTDIKGPFDGTKLKCVLNDQYCLNVDLGITMQLTNFAANQRLYNIYDGPTYQDSNAYLDIPTAPCDTSASETTCMYRNTVGVRLDNSATPKGYLPNAAIGWKQSNGFYYPPAFHSTNLFFDKVAIRHYVIEPFLKAYTYITDVDMAKLHYIRRDPLPLDMFTNYTDVDRQTELSDDDGTLTGLTGPANALTTDPKDVIPSISVNKDDFFNAPVETDQCLSNLGVIPDKSCGKGATTTRATAKTSPYDYVTTVVYPGCALGDNNDALCGSYNQRSDNVCQLVVIGLNTVEQCTKMKGRGGIWSKDCTAPYCYGVPIFRQFLTGSDTKGAETREWQDWIANNCNTAPSSFNCQLGLARMAGTAKYQRSVMTVNHGTYFIDTTRSQDEQKTSEYTGLNTNINNSNVECDTKVGNGPRSAIGACHPRSVNAFQPGEKYYVFFVYAKPTTTQTYQIYVGEDFDLSSVKIKKILIPSSYKKQDVPDDNVNIAKGWPVRWAKPKFIPGADGKLDVLEVTVDFTVAPFKDSLDPGNTKNGTCHPASFCTASGASCKCNLSSTDPRVLASKTLMKACQNTCENWAVKDLDCPNGVCWGFEFTLPTGFQAKGKLDDKTRLFSQYKRPKPTMFDPTKDRFWLTQFLGTTIAPDSKAKATCNYARIPDQNCPPPPATLRAK